MAVVRFPQYGYVPVLGTTEVDRLAYERLREATRDGILPVFELTRHRGATSFLPAVTLLEQTVTHPFVLDVDARIAPPPYVSANPSNPIADRQRVARETQENSEFNANLNNLLSPYNGFQVWRDLAANFPNAIPVLQYTNPSSQHSAIIRQAALLSQRGQSIAMRIIAAQSDALCEIAAQIITILPSSSQILLIFDCGQGRRGAGEKAEWVRSCLQNVTGRIEVGQSVELSAVCMSNSYKQLAHEGLLSISSCDREIWAEASTSFQFMYGDYAASARSPNLNAFLPRSYRATIVHSQGEQWITHRHENADDPNGWQIGAAAILASGLFDPIGSWADDQIALAAAGAAIGMDSPRPWHAARISGHIERQFEYQPEVENDL